MIIERNKMTKLLSEIQPGSTFVFADDPLGDLYLYISNVSDESAMVFDLEKNTQVVCYLSKSVILRMCKIVEL